MSTKSCENRSNGSIACCPTGRGARRAPYDFIFTDDGISLRRLAETLPALEEVYDDKAQHAVTGGSLARKGSYGPGLEGRRRRVSSKRAEMDDEDAKWSG